MVWYKNPVFLSTAGAIVVALITYVSAHPTLAPLVGILVFASTTIHNELTPNSPSPSNNNPNPPPQPSAITGISYTIGGQTISADLNSPLNATESVALLGGATQNYSVGQQTINTITTAKGTLIPKGAVYVGKGAFELNGNYYD